MEEKLIYVTVPTEGKTVAINEVEGISNYIKNGYRIEKIIPNSSSSEFVCIYLIHLKK